MIGIFDFSGLLGFDFLTALDFFVDIVFIELFFIDLRTGICFFIFDPFFIETFFMVLVVPFALGVLPLVFIAFIVFIDFPMERERRRTEDNEEARQRRRISSA